MYDILRIMALLPDTLQVRSLHQSEGEGLDLMVATFDAFTGRVVAQSGSKVGISELVRFYERVRQAYPAVERIFLVQDNWPIHFHPDVLLALEPQHSPFPFHVPASWPTEPSPAARKPWGIWKLPIQLLLLPTFVSWCNPIEKLWRKLKQEVVHVHRRSADLVSLRALVRNFLQQFAAGSSDLLRYVGLLIPD